ncbi:hypothetical protein EM89_023145 [Vibrio parahaemolyticus]|uniref:hypothetical protein n=1 Tax=Vibrio parahaemolyticus TaxID=670 RepID=UPI00041BDD18|nr:hypothetical protein [Vibrio parahaemolyticus]OQJ89561.1 hypothetical protein AGE71_23105 [Vibrio parahaemolyticus]OQS70266.1 hypothetical protein EM89_023145 [Vibrio parahaemolyticus]OQS93305.1 hypothetical protein EN04_023000 [Vibrio parahaemolyticus O4:K12 str. K1203]PNO25170.1 hypothetical protein RK53_006275 [Vibrio parahaemolyticus]
MTKNNVVSELEVLKNDFSDLMALFDNPKQNLPLISEKYSSLKTQVNERLKALEKAEKADKLNQTETNFLLPAIREVSLHCTAKVGATNLEQLSSSIYDGKDYCSYWLTELNA